MRSSFFTLLLAGSTLVSAAPRPKPFLDGLGDLLKRTITTDGSCGGAKGYTCPGTGDNCCSQYGWCGDTTAHCGTNCQSAFGICTGTGTNPPTNPPAGTTTATPGPATPNPNPNPSNPPSTEYRSKPGSVAYGSPITNCNKAGVIALTFDDGPAESTNKILNQLADAGFKATFFVNGNNWNNIEEDIFTHAILARIVTEGHQLASHTWSHASLDKLQTTAAQTAEMTRLENALKNIVGKYPTYMRPPYLECVTPLCLATMDTLGYHVIMENLDTKDYENNKPGTNSKSQNAFDTLLNANIANRNVLMHDVHPTTADLLLPHVITTLKAKGLVSVTIGECLNDPAENWYRS